jgi:hypothetical protein
MLALPFDGAPVDVAGARVDGCPEFLQHLDGSKKPPSSPWVGQNYFGGVGQFYFGDDTSLKFTLMCDLRQTARFQRDSTHPIVLRPMRQPAGLYSGMSSYPEDDRLHRKPCRSANA